jgi:hypothetical protein
LMTRIGDRGIADIARHRRHRKSKSTRDERTLPKSGN